MMVMKCGNQIFHGNYHIGTGVSTTQTFNCTKNFFTRLESSVGQVRL